MQFRKHIRLKHYDYKSNGYYFVTICTAQRKPYLKMAEKLIENELSNLTQRFTGLKNDYYKIMPTHLHWIIILRDSPDSLNEIVGAYKSITTVKILKKHPQGVQLQDGRLWQPNYYEHVIRNEASLGKICEYIANNPLVEKLNWKELDP